MNKLIIISTNNTVFYGIIIKNNTNNIIYDVIASDNIYKNDRRLYSLKYNSNDVDKFINANKINANFTYGIRPNVKKLKNAVLSKNKLYQMDIEDKI